MSNERDKRKEELLSELSKRFKDSADTMKKVAARIQSAAKQSQHLDKRLKNADSDLHECLESKQGPMPFSYLEYVEFTSAAEFAKYRGMSVITDEELASVDMDDLCNKLLEC